MGGPLELRLLDVPLDRLQLERAAREVLVGDVDVVEGDVASLVDLGHGVGDGLQAGAVDGPADEGTRGGVQRRRRQG